MRTTNTEYQLDLHGEVKETAIRNLTYFLDELRHKYKKRKESSLWVTIVTGSGSHSSNGPILRNAVEKTLKKRQMTHQLTHKKGAFRVDAMSGIELYEEPVQDTKILLVPDQEFSLLSRDANARPPPFKHHPVTAASPSISTSTSISNTTDDPSPSEVAAHDKDVAKVKELSLKEAALEQSKRVKETNVLNKVVSLSIEEKLEEESTLIAKGIETSKSFAKSEEERLEQELKDVLELSRKEADLEEETLQYALLLSQNEVVGNNNIHDDDDQIAMDEERSLQLALEMSKVEVAMK